MKSSSAHIHYYRNTPFLQRHQRSVVSSGEIKKSLSEYPRKYENVAIFNLRKGCEVKKIDSSLKVTLNTQTFFEKDKPKSTVTKLSPKRMEEMIKQLVEQVHYLNTYLEEEKMRHLGTKKRLNADLENCRVVLNKQHESEIAQIRSSHQEMMADVKNQHNEEMSRAEDEFERKYGKLKEEYRMLETSLQTFKTTLSDELEAKLNKKEMELQWEKQHLRDKLAEEIKHSLFKQFTQEKEDLKQEYKEMVQKMMSDQRKEIENNIRKSTEGFTIEELKGKAKRADELESLLDEIRENNGTLEKELKRVTRELNETQAQLAVFQQRFDEKVAIVEDKYRNKINDLTLEVSDLRVKWIHQSEALYIEQRELDILQNERTKLAKKNFKATMGEKTKSLVVLNDATKERPHEPNNDKLNIIDNKKDIKNTKTIAINIDTWKNKTNIDDLLDSSDRIPMSISTDDNSDGTLDVSLVSQELTRSKFINEFVEMSPRRSPQRVTFADEAQDCQYSRPTSPSVIF